MVAILALLFYVAAVMATQLFGGDFPQWFGTLWNSLYSLFQIMTLESWSMGIVRPVMEVQPYAWAFFVRNLSTTLRHGRLRFTEQSLLLWMWMWQVG